MCTCNVQIVVPALCSTQPAPFPFRLIRSPLYVVVFLLGVLAVMKGSCHPSPTTPVSDRFLPSSTWGSAEHISVDADLSSDDEPSSGCCGNAVMVHVGDASVGPRSRRVFCRYSLL